MDWKALVRAQAEGKAFNPNPAFEDYGSSVSVIDLNLGRLPGVSPSGQGITGPRKIQRQAKTYTSSYAGKQAMDWVGSCVRYWADAVATADYHFEKPKKRTAIKKPGEPVDAPEDLEKLLEDPNPYMDYGELMELLVMDLLLVGNAYWFKWRIKENGKPLAIYRLAPPYVEVITTPWGPGAYVYQIPNGGSKLVIEPEEIIHFKLATPDCDNPYYGAGIIQAAGRAADLEIALTHTQSAYYENRAMPSLAVESERRVPRDVFKKIRAQLRARMQGPRNAGELLVLEAGLKLNPLAPNATDAAFVAVSKMSRDRVFGWFKMHPSQIGITDGSMTAGFLSEMKRQWDNTAARPFMDKIDKKITNDLVKPWNLHYVIDYEYQLTPEDRAKLAGSVGQLPGVQVDEAREIGGYGPHPEKDIGEMTLNLPGQDAGTGQPGETPTRNGFPDRNLPSEAGRPPKAGNTKAFPKKGAALPAGSAAKRGKGKKALTLDEISTRLDEIQTPADRQPVDQLEHKRVSDVDEATGEFSRDLSRAARVLERGLLDTVEGKAFDPKDVVAKLRQSKAWASFDDLAKQAYEQALLKVMSAAAIHHGELGLKPTGEIDYEKLIDELVNRKESGVKAITQTLKDSVAETVKEQRKEDPSKAEIEGAVQEAVAKWIANKAQMIALTEATRGYNESTLSVAEKSGFTKVFVTDGDEYDAPCVEANGSTWTLEYAKEHSLEHPRCRRAFVPIEK